MSLAQFGTVLLAVSALAGFGAFIAWLVTRTGSTAYIVAVLIFAIFLMITVLLTAPPAG